MTLARSPAVSVVVCTHNRAADARRCVDAVAPQIAAAGWELLVVDSASSAVHARALAALPAVYPGTTLVRLEQPGLAAARNRGAELARGDWIAYLDDDAIAQHGWATQLGIVLCAVPSSVAMVGGRIKPLWPTTELPPTPLRPPRGGDTVPGDQVATYQRQPSDEVTARWLLMLSCVDVPVRGRVADGYNICGANFAIRREALAAIGGFPTSLGRVGGRLISGEESYVILRLQHNGLDAVYDPSFLVLHCVESKRLTRQWIAQRAYWEGVTQVQLHRTLQQPMPWALAPLKLLASIPALWVLRWLRRTNPDYLIRLNMACGSLYARRHDAQTVSP